MYICLNYMYIVTSHFNEIYRTFTIYVLRGSLRDPSGDPNSFAISIALLVSPCTSTKL